MCTILEADLPTLVCSCTFKLWCGNYSYQLHKLQLEKHLWTCSTEQLKRRLKSSNQSDVFWHLQLLLDVTELSLSLSKRKLQSINHIIITLGIQWFDMSHLQVWQCRSHQMLVSRLILHCPCCQEQWPFHRAHLTPSWTSSLKPYRSFHITTANNKSVKLEHSSLRNEVLEGNVEFTGSWNWRDG